jgi:hypothetical protein
MLADVALEEVQERVTSPPPEGSEDGDAVNVPLGKAGEATVTETEYWRVPLALVNVRTNVDDDVTFRVVDPLKGTAPTPWLIIALVAFVDDHDSVTLPPPAGSEEGIALIEPVGNGPGGVMLFTAFTMDLRRGSR